MKYLNARRQALALGLVSLLSLSACGGGGSDSGTPVQPWSQTSGSTAVTTLSTTDTVAGTGATAAAGNTVNVKYTGWLYDVRVATTQKGTQFDTGTFSFKLGTTPLQVIPGFDQGVTGMKVGGKRTVVIPASLGYGAAGTSDGKIPANAALIFDIELVSVQ